MAKKQPAKKSESVKTGRPQKYTLEYVRSEAKEFLDYVNKNADALFIDEFVVTRDYHPQRWSEWQKDYGNDDEFSEAIKKGEKILEMRLAKSGIQGKTNATMTIFVLANKYGYSRVDKPTEQQPDTSVEDLAAMFKAMVSATKGSGGTP